MSRVKYKVEFRGYGKDNGGYAGILNYLASKKCPDKNLIIRIDADSVSKRSKNEDDMFFPKSLHIYNLNINFHEKDSNEYDTAEFTVNYDDAFDICRLLELLASAGNPGHSYNVLLNNKENINIDGDGSDYLKSINGKDINYVIKNIYHFRNYWDFFEIESPENKKKDESNMIKNNKKDLYESVMNSLRNQFNFLNEYNDWRNYEDDEFIEINKKAINYDSIPNKYKFVDEYGYNVMFDKMSDDEFEEIVSNMRWIEKDKNGNFVNLGDMFDNELKMSGGSISYNVPLLYDCTIKLTVDFEWEYIPYTHASYDDPAEGGYGELTNMTIADATLIFKYHDPVTRKFLIKSREIKRNSTLASLNKAFDNLIDEELVDYDNDYFAPDYPEWDDD